MILLVARKIFRPIATNSDQYRPKQRSFRKVGHIQIDRIRYEIECKISIQETTTGKKMDIELIQCEVCKASISPLSATCVKCGNPNEWTHPKIQNFIDNPPEVDEGFRYNWDRTTIRGTTKRPFTKAKKYTLYGMGGLLYLISFVTFGVLISMAFLFISFLLISLYEEKRDPYYFSYDAKTNEWKTNNEEMYKEIKNALKD